MKSSVSVAEKKEFIHWFLERFDFQKKEAAWLLGYLYSNEKVLKKVCFVDHVRNLPKSLIISTRCSKMIPFRFTKNKQVHTDVETAFYDIRTYPHEELYISLYFKERYSCSKFTAVLEVNSMKKHDLVQDHLLSLFAEMLLDQAVKDFEKKRLYEKIDDALAKRDVETFLQLSKQWKEILES